MPRQCALTTWCFGMAWCMMLCSAHIVPAKIGGCEVDIAFILDGSGSVGEGNWRRVKQFVSVFASRLKEDVNISPKIGVVTFGNSARLDIKLSQYHDARNFAELVRPIKFRDENTNTYAGLHVARTQLFTKENGDREIADNIAILITDGMWTYEVSKTIPEAMKMREDGINLFAVGIGPELNRTKMLQLVERLENMNFVTDFEDLVASVENTILRSCGSLKTSTKLPMTTPSFSPLCDNLDLVFALDASGSIGEAKFKKLIEIMKSMVSTFSLAPERTKVGFVSFSSEAFVNIQLGQYSTVREVTAALDRIEWRNQMTNISGAIRTARTAMFTTSNDRPGSPNVFVILTDNRANRELGMVGREAKLLKDTGATCFVVGIGNQIYVEGLVAIASRPTFFYLMLLVDNDDLDSKQELILGRLCSKRPPPIEEPPEPGSCEFDMVTIFHEPSGNTGTFTKMKNYLRKLATTLDFNSHRLAVVSLGVREVIRIGRYPTKPEFLQFLANLQYPGSSRPPAQSLIKTLQEISLPGQGGWNVKRPKLILLMSSAGIGQPDLRDLEREARRARAAGVWMFVVEFGRSETRNPSDLRGVASQPTDLFYIRVQNVDDLGQGNMSANMLTCLCLAIGHSDVTCEFETREGTPTMCDLTQSTNDNFDWTVNRGGTPSRHTGPTSAKTGTCYVYIETSNPQKLGDMAELMLPRLRSSGTTCLTFYYHMRGYNTGRLEVYVKSSLPSTGVKGRSWLLTGHQGDIWRLGMVTLVLSPSDQVSLRATRGVEFSGDIALDHIRLVDGACPRVTLPSSGLMIL